MFLNAGPGHTLNLEAFFRFLVDCAKDPRFNADNLMREINLVTDLPFDDALAYRFLIIPMTKKRLIEREKQFAWIYRKDFPDWGRGRDDSMNLTKYFMLELPMDNTFGPGDIPSIWNLKKYDVAGTTMNWSGDSHDAYSVIIDSALGVLGAPPKNNDEFLEQIKWLQDYLSNKPAPKYPFAIDAARAEAGKAVFDQHCATCHASDKTGRRMPLAGVDTDRGRMDTWNKDNAVAANKVVTEMGITRKGLVEAPLDRLQPAVSRWRLGARRRTCTTARCRRCAICSNRRPIGPQVVLARLRPVRPEERRLRLAGGGSRTRRHEVRYQRSSPTATVGMCSARRCRPRRRKVCSST